MSIIKIEKMDASHWHEVKRIYNVGIATKNATFQTEAPNWVSWDQNHRQDCRLIAISDDRVAAWAALSNVSNRCVYAGVAEVSIYVDSEFRGLGIGDKLLKQLILESEQNGLWTLQAGIFPENSASLRLHLKNGFRTLGIREKIGKMDSVWRDVVLLERRSQMIGIC